MYNILKFKNCCPHLSTNRRNEIKRWKNTRGFPVQFAKWWHCTYTYCSTVTAYWQVQQMRIVVLII